MCGQLKLVVLKWGLASSHSYGQISACVSFIKPGPTLDFQGGRGLGGGDLIGVLSNVCASGDDDDEASDGTVHLTQRVLIEVDGLAIFQPLALSRGVGYFTLEQGSLGVGHYQITQGLLDSATWEQRIVSISQHLLQLA